LLYLINNNHLFPTQLLLNTKYVTNDIFSTQFSLFFATGVLVILRVLSQEWLALLRQGTF